MSFLFIYLKQTSVHYVQVRLLDGWVGRGPSWVGAQWWLKGVRRVLGPAWPVGWLLHSCYPARFLEAAPPPTAHLMASLGGDLPAPKQNEEASSYSKINKCLAWDLTTLPSAQACKSHLPDWAGKPGPARRGLGVPNSLCHPMAQGVAGRAGRGQRRGALAPRLRQSRARVVKPRAGPAFGTMRRGWHSGHGQG